MLPSLCGSGRVAHCCNTDASSLIPIKLDDTPVEPKDREHTARSADPFSSYLSAWTSKLCGIVITISYLHYRKLWKVHLTLTIGTVFFRKTSTVVYIGEIFNDVASAEYLTILLVWPLLKCPATMHTGRAPFVYSLMSPKAKISHSSRRLKAS